MMGRGLSLRMGLFLAVCGTSALSESAFAAVTINTVTVGDAGNTADSRTGRGSVSYAYNIGTYEVTAAQYTAFLNAVAKSDTYGLYNSNMWSAADGCRIQQSGSNGNYTYSVATDYANRPVNYVSFWDAARFANWLNGGQQSGSESITDNGTYSIYNSNTRATGWVWAVASEDEWYKAAFYKGGGTNAGYWTYATQSNTMPGRDLSDPAGNNANWRKSSESPYPIDLGTYYTTNVGEFQNSAGAYGTFDQSGNVWEWLDTMNSSGKPMVRGGAFDDGWNLGIEGYTYQNVGKESGDIGFRMVSSSVPEPSAMVLLVSGATALWMRRRAS